MANLADIDTSNVAPATFDPIPAGEYVAVITASERKSSEKGQYIELTLQVIDGQYENRKVWDRLTIIGGEKAVGRGLSMLSALKVATGVLAPQDSAELHDIPIRIKVGIEPASGEYAAKNNVKGYSAAGAAGKAATFAPAAAAPAAAAPTKPAAPWLKK